MFGFHWGTFPILTGCFIEWVQTCQPNLMQFGWPWELFKANKSLTTRNPISCLLSIDQCGIIIRANIRGELQEMLLLNPLRWHRLYIDINHRSEKKMQRQIHSFTFSWRILCQRMNNSTYFSFYGLKIDVWFRRIFTQGFSVRLIPTCEYKCGMLAQRMAEQ